MKRKKLFTVACGFAVLIIVFSVLNIVLSENGKKPLYYLSRFTVSSTIVYTNGRTKSAQISERDSTRLFTILKEARAAKKADVTFREAKFLYAPSVKIYLKPFGSIDVYFSNGYFAVGNTIYCIDEKYMPVFSHIGMDLANYETHYHILDLTLPNI